MHGIKYELAIAADHSITVTSVHQPPLSLEVSEHANRFRQNRITAKVLAQDVQSGLTLLPLRAGVGPTCSGNNPAMNKPRNQR